MNYIVFVYPVYKQYSVSSDDYKDETKSTF